MPKPNQSSCLSRPTFALCAIVGSLSGCGGGGNESGPPDELYLSSTSITVSGTSSTTCAAGNGPTVYVFGGMPPYKLSNSAPGAMELSTGRLKDSGDGFSIRFNGACFDNLPVVVEDDMGRLASLSVSSVYGTLP